MTKKKRLFFFVGAGYDKETGTYNDVYGAPSTLLRSEAAADDIVYDGVRPSPPY